MANDSTELTFVRCPSCRSLVPAMSKTCRMCGAGLDASPKADEGTQKSGRVRQRTLSQSREDVAAAVNRIREEMHIEIPPPPPQSGGADRSGELTDMDDPLSAYIEEVEVSPNGGANGSSREGDTVHDDIRQEFAEGSSNPEEFSSSEDTEPPAEAVAPKTRVVIESGGRKPNKSGGLNFGQKPRDERHPPRASESSYAAGSRDERRQPQPERREARQVERREEAPRVESQSFAGGEDRPRSSEVRRRSIQSGGRLAGWLVSFVDPNGAALEIREGKFFISGSRVKDTDLVIEDPSVSSPHAICIGGEGKMKIQDLMSDEGVFIKRRSESEYSRISEASEVSHGDWIRLGNVEFNVCLIAHVGEK